MKRVITSIPTTGPPPKPFAAHLMHAIWSKQHALVEGELEEYPDLRIATYAFRSMCGLTQEQLAARMGIMPAKLALIEKRGHPITMEDIVRLKALAWEFSLFKIYMYFDRQIYVQRGKMKKVHPPKPYGT